MKCYGIVSNLSKVNALDVSSRIVDLLQKSHQSYIIEEGAGKQLKVEKSRRASLKTIFKKASILIALGGDGTILNLVRSMPPKKIPILGVNLGGLGFLTEVKVSELEHSLTLLIKGEYLVEERLTLEAEVKRKSKVISSYVALNDVVLTNGSMARVIDLDVMIGKEHVTSYMSDGLIISTPTGSTAYSLSSGGPIVHPATPAILMTPISPHTLTNRPIVVPEDRLLKIKVGKTLDDVVLTVDGQEHALLKCNDVVEVKKSRHHAKLIILKKTSYFNILREKLGWGGGSKKK